MSAPTLTAVKTAANRDMIMKVATGTLDAVRMAETSDPDLATFLNGQAAITSRALYGPVLTWILTFVVGYFGLGMDAATIAALAGLLAVPVGMLFRVLAKAPITGFFSPASITPPATTTGNQP